MITQRQRLRIKREMAVEKPTLWIGKNGITDEVIREVSNQLKKNQMVKIRMLKSAVKQDDEINSLVRELVDKTDTTRIDIRGRNFILYKIDKNGEKTD
ncbi:MAG: RNA-binding protein [Thermoproteota archaeon]|nr:RNA-binding protein [Thermoproteota archaeon]